MSANVSFLEGLTEDHLSQLVSDLPDLQVFGPSNTTMDESISAPAAPAIHADDQPKNGQNHPNELRWTRSAHQWTGYAPHQTGSAAHQWTGSAAHQWTGSPISGQDHPSNEHNQPTVGQDQRTSGQDQPTSGQDQPTSGHDLQPTSGRDQHTSGQDQPTSGQGLQPTSGQDLQSTSGQDQPTSAQDQPIKDERGDTGAIAAKSWCRSAGCRFSFSLIWDPMGAKTSKRYFSLKSLLNSFKLVVKFLLSGPHKSTVLDF